MIDISIVVPMHNSQESIGNCINSLQKQSFRKFQVVLIDDGSMDHTVDICKRAIKKDNRFQLIQEEKHGVSYTRNVGIKNCIGTYLMFVDADDTVTPDFLAIMYKAMKSGKSQLAVCGYNKIYIDKINNVLPKIPALSSQSQTLVNLLNVKAYNSCLWNKIFVLDIIKKNNIQLKENLTIGEDLKFCADYIAYISQTTYIRKSLYNYYITSESAMHRSNSVRSFESEWLSEWDSINSICLNKFNDSREVTKAFNFRKMSIALKMIILMKKYSYNDKAKVFSIMNYIRQNKRYILFNYVLSTKRMVKGLIAYAHFKER